MDKRMLNLVVGIGLAVIAIFMIHGYMQQRENLIQELIRKGEIIEVLISRADIPKESTITVDMVANIRIRSSAYQPGDLTSPDSAIGKLAIVDILKGQHMNRNMLKSLASARFLSQRTPKGMRAMTIAVDRISALEGLIKPGDYIDIIGTFNMGEGRIVVVTLFQGIQVLAMGKNLSPYRIVHGTSTVTIALRPGDIKLLTFVLDSGNKIRLTLRAPLDPSVDTYLAVGTETLMKRLGMWAAPPKAEEERKVPVIYRGPKR